MYTIFQTNVYCTTQYCCYLKLVLAERSLLRTEDADIWCWFLLIKKTVSIFIYIIIIITYNTNLSSATCWNRVCLTKTFISIVHFIHSCYSSATGNSGWQTVELQLHPFITLRKLRRVLELLNLVVLWLFGLSIDPNFPQS